MNIILFSDYPGYLLFLLYIFFFVLFCFFEDFFFFSLETYILKKIFWTKKKFHGKKKISWSKEKIWIVKSPEKQREYPGKKKDSPGIKKKKREFPGKQKSPEKSFSWGKHSRENIISWKKKKICTKKSAWKKKKESPGERNSPEKYLKKISCEIKVCHTS